MSQQDRDRANRDVLMEEIVWQLDAGTHPELIAQLFGVTREALLHRTRRAGREDIRSRLILDEYAEKVWRGHSFVNHDETRRAS